MTIERVVGTRLIFYRMNCYEDHMDRGGHEDGVYTFCYEANGYDLIQHS